MLRPTPGVPVPRTAEPPAAVLRRPMFVATTLALSLVFSPVTALTQAPIVPVTPMEGTTFLPADTSPTGIIPNAAYHPTEDEEPRRTGLWWMYEISRESSA